MESCGIPILAGGECDGHLGKFDDCLAEALREWLMSDFADGTTGTGDFEGHTAIFVVKQDEPVTIDPDGVGRTVAVPAGSYLLFESSTGAVTYMVAESEEQAWEIFQANDLRYALWDHGCDPNDSAGHQACFEHDQCQRPEWAG